MAPQRRGRAWIGTSGFIYRHWSGGVFYPPKLPQSRWLEHYASRFDTLEFNVTFYRLPSREAFAGWRRRTPAGFGFAVKGSRFITHIKRLKDCRRPLEIFFQRADLLEEKVRVVLWQLPPRLGRNVPRLAAFLKELERYRHVRHAFEFRDASWLDEEVFRLLRSHGAGIVRADAPSVGADAPVTADFVYVRRHGRRDGRNYLGLYSAADLRADASAISAWLKEGKDVFVYFNNDAKGHAARNALELKELLDERAAPPARGPRAERRGHRRSPPRRRPSKTRRGRTLV